MAYHYTDQEFADIQQRYRCGESLEQIHRAHPSKSVASIRMKLVRAKLYVAQKTEDELHAQQAYKQAEAAVGLAAF